jgi:hypothetical protein
MHEVPFNGAAEEYDDHGPFYDGKAARQFYPSAVP